ncbi:hypothetical protein E4U23_006416 [Claviceps purpurea]|nr:hypothetical protein E4U23_006416 [Claviceps purpurea]
MYQKGAILYLNPMYTKGLVQIQRQTYGRDNRGRQTEGITSAGSTFRVSGVEEAGVEALGSYPSPVTNAGAGSVVWWRK